MSTYPVHEGLQAVPDSAGLEHTQYNPMEARKNYPIVVDEQQHQNGLETGEYYGAQKADGYLEVPTAYGKEVPVRDSRVCGLRRKSFWILFVVAVIIIVAAAVGGGVGGYEASHNKNLAEDQILNTNLPSSSSSTPTKSTDASITSSTTGTIITSTSATKTTSTSTGTTTTYAQTAYPTTSLGINCPAINGTTYVATDAQDNTAYTFDVYCNANFAAGDDTGNSNETSLDNCMQACVNLKAAGGVCVGVVWDSIMNLSLDPLRNCFMKSSQGSFAWTGNSNNSASALIVSS